MTALYLVAAQYRDAAAKLADLELDPVTLADTLESLSGDLEAKGTNVAFVVRGMEAEAAAVKAWAKEASERAKLIEARAERLREYLSSNMQACGITKISGPGITLSFRASHAVVIDDAEQIPAAFLRFKPAPPPEPDKAAIAAIIKLGEVVPGAHVETRQSLQVRA